MIIHCLFLKRENNLQFPTLAQHLPSICPAPNLAAAALLATLLPTRVPPPPCCTAEDIFISKNSNSLPHYPPGSHPPPLYSYLKNFKL